MAVDPLTAGLDLAGSLVGSGGLLDDLFFTPEEQASQQLQQQGIQAQRDIAQSQAEVAKLQASAALVSAQSKASTTRTLVIAGVLGVLALGAVLLVARSG